MFRERYSGELTPSGNSGIGGIDRGIEESSCESCFAVEGRLLSAAGGDNGEEACLDLVGNRENPRPRLDFGGAGVLSELELAMDLLSA